MDNNGNNNHDNDQMSGPVALLLPFQKGNKHFYNCTLTGLLLLEIGFYIINKGYIVMQEA